MRRGTTGPGAAVVLALLAVLLTVGSAAAKDRAVAVQAWTRTGAVPTFVAEEGRLYVAADLATEQARAFLRVDLDAINPATGRGTLTVVEAAGTTLPDGAALVACPLTSALEGTGELSAADAPSADCSSAVPAERTADGTWTIPLRVLLERWRAGGQPGLALVPQVSPTTPPFQLSFDPALTALALPRPPRTDRVTAPGNGPAPERPAEPGPVALTERAATSGQPVTGIEPPGVAVPPDLAAPSGSGAPGEPEPVAAPMAEAPTPVAPQPVAAPRSAGSPPTPAVLALVAVLALGPAVLRARRDPDGPEAAARRGATASGVVRPLSLALGAVAFVGLPLLLAEATVFNVGLVLIFGVGAIGLHLLVNWAGELSLAHATMIGFPAFAVAKLSADWGVSPLLLLPVGVIVGAMVGGIVGLPAIRARGLQVALVTLAAGVAIDRFFFTRSWFVGPPAGAQVSVPTLGPLTFPTARSLYPVLAVLVLATIGATWMLYRSKLVRGMLWVKADPDAAAAFGIPAARYRTLAYVIAGTFAGLAGALTAMWVQRLTPQAFPLNHSFAYLLVVALAGRGFIGGVGAATVAVEGGRLFLSTGGALLAYGAPVALILTLTRHREGLNGLGRRLQSLTGELRKGTRTMANDERSSGPGIRPPAVIAVLAIALGFTSIALAWYHAGNTPDVWVQNQELISGGIGGLGLILLGVGMLVYDGIVASRAAAARRWDRLIGLLERDESADPTLPLSLLQATEASEERRHHRVAAR